MKKLTYVLLMLLICTYSAYTQQQSTAIPAIPIEVDSKVTVQPVATPISSSSHNKQQIIEVQLEETIVQNMNEQLPAWIQQELHQTTTYIDLPITETFSFVLKSGQQTTFKWDPSKQKQLKLIVDVFYLTSNGGLSVINDAEQNEFLQITAKNPDAVFYGFIGKVYRSKVITVDFDTDFKYLKFDNKNSQTVLVQIDIQKLNFVVQKGVHDDLLTTARTKVNSIIQQTKSTEVRREHLYKWQWGFYQNEKNHESQVLGLTVVQLFTILLTACIQMYCLKGLLDNRAVV